MSILQVLAIIIGSIFGLMLLLYYGGRLVTSAYFRSKKEFLKSLLGEKEREDEQS